MDTFPASRGLSRRGKNVIFASPWETSASREMDTLDALEILPGYKEQFMPNLTGSY